ncbi:MAG: hypothetical protein IJM02_06670 [Clostridia bacterium]|nr:hypothetical protein [Clostridia bacterium]
MENGNLSAADVALLADRNGGDCWGNNSMIWIFALLILATGGFGGLGWGNNGVANALGYENLATSNEVQRGFDNQNLQAQTRDILAAVNAGTAQSVAATNQTFHDNLAAMQSLYNETSRDIAGLAMGQANMLANQNECCCSTKMAIAESTAGINANLAQGRYEAAMNTAAINANTTAQTQRILDAISQDKIEALQGRINTLELQQAVAGVVRYPMSTAYTSGCNPFCGCGC